MKYKVIIVEDDPMVASINKQYVERNSHLILSEVFKNGKDALLYLKSNKVDLVILDMYMPVMDGKQFLKELRSLGNNVDVIMVTAATDINSIQNLLSFGLVDYLVKPFEYSRFAQSLERFLQKKSIISHNQCLSQSQLDDYLSFSLNAEKEVLPSKGLQTKTLESIRNYLRNHADEPLTSEQIADEVGLSRVTIRRYMNYLIELKEVSSDIDYNTGGRPSILYHYNR